MTSSTPSVPEVSWSGLAAARPDLAAEARALFYEVGIGLGFLATIRPDGGPRVHPICPLIDGELYAFIVDGPKLADLRRDGRYALHGETVGPPNQDDAIYLTGTVVEPDDPALRTALADRFFAEREMAEPWPDFDTQVLVELRIDRLLLTLTQPRGGLPAGHTVWRPAT